MSTYADPSAKGPQPLQKSLAECSPNTKSGVQEYVPRRSKFMDAIRSCIQATTARGFAASFPSSEEIMSPLISTGVLRDESRLAHRKMVSCAAAVIDDQQRDWLRKAVRIAFSDDDRDQHRILRIRMVWASPSVGCAEFFGALLKDYGFDAEECRDASLEGLKRMCSTRGRPQQGVKPTLARPMQLDEALWDEVRQKIISGATDGAAVALKGVALMKAEMCPNLRYQFRDRPHTTRTIQKLSFEVCPESEEVRRRLITGKQSFARRAKNSRRFAEVWKRKQAEDSR